MCFREEHTTAGQDVRRVARVARWGVEAVIVLGAEVGCAELRQVAEDAGAFIGCVGFSLGEPERWLVASVQGLTLSIQAAMVAITFRSTCPGLLYSSGVGGPVPLRKRWSA
jgi:hypothetical protein